MRAALPAGWFPDVAPVLGAVLAGFGAVWAAIFTLYTFLLAQTRIATSTGPMLDLVAQDFFGQNLPRRAGESDAAFRARIALEMFRQRGTRASVVQVLTDLVGKTPIIFEPAYPYDTGAYGAAAGGLGTAAYGRAGGYGSLLLPFQFFVIGIRGSTSPIANVGGYYYGSGWDGGGYGIGAIEYASIQQFEGLVTDADMYAAVSSVRPVATIGWMALANASPWTVPPNPVTGLAAG